MKILISPVSVEEALAVWRGGADIVDIKNVAEGSLGASFPWMIRGVIEALAGANVAFSATLGDLPAKPGTAALAARGACSLGVQYIKAGLHGMNTYEDALSVMQAVARACHDVDPAVAVVAAGYADYRRFDGLDPFTLVKVARAAGANVVMIDTAFKDGSTLFDALSVMETAEFVNEGHRAGLQVALAGSIKREQLGVLRQLNPDIVGIRGAVCASHDRTSVIDAALVSAFVEEARLRLAV
jgi:hypothetical protein